MSKETNPTTPTSNTPPSERVGVPVERTARQEQEEVVQGTQADTPPVSTRTRRALFSEGSAGKSIIDEAEELLQQRLSDEEQSREVDDEDSTTSSKADSTTRMSKFSGVITETSERSQAELEKGRVSVPRSERGAVGKDREKVKRLATAALEPKFGVPKHFVMGEGEAEDGASRIQESFVGLAQRTKRLKDRCRDYDMMTTLLIPKLIDKDATDLDSKWGDTRNLLDHFGTVTLEECKEWTKLILLRGHESEVENQNWLLQLARGSCTEGLQTRIENKFDKLSVEYQGGVVYIKLMYDILVHLTEAVVTALQRYVKHFATKGLFKYSGESPSIAETEMVAVCRRLDEAGKLLDDSVDDVLSGLTKVTHKEFKKTFEDIKSLRGQTLLGVRDIEGSTLERIERVFELAVEKFNEYSLAESWHVQAKNNSSQAYHCWNCGDESHRSDTCPKDRDPETWKKNRDAALNKKNAGGGVGGTKKSTNRNGYSRGNFSRPKNGESVRKINNVWYCHCSKGCGWNKSHTSNFHGEWEGNKSAFCLPDSHPHSLHVAKDSGHSKSDQSKEDGKAPSKPPTKAAEQAQGSANMFNQVTDKCGELERSSEDPNVAALAGLLKTVFASLKD